MKGLYIAGAVGAFLMLAGSVNAGDLEPGQISAFPAGVFSWTGPYAGLFAGSGWGKAEATEPINVATGFPYNVGANSYSVDPDGFFGGGTLGYNWQSGAFVFGFEGEAGYLGLMAHVSTRTGSQLARPTLPRRLSPIFMRL